MPDWHNRLVKNAAITAAPSHSAESRIVAQSKSARVISAISIRTRPSLLDAVPSLQRPRRDKGTVKAEGKERVGIFV